MDNLDDLKAIWHTAKTDNLPSSKEMIKLVKGFRGQKLRKKWLVIILSLALSCLIIIALFIGQFKLVTTFIGGGLMAASALLLAATNVRSLKRFYRLDDCSNLEFLAFIEQTRQNQIYYYKKTMVMILLLCSIGWGLYLYEPVRQHTLWLIATYTGAAIYLAIMWFIVRPRTFKRNAEKLNVITRRLESISKQLK
ncbi:hypothetical protein [Mucilaginibacter panaciglaebae]|uniref:Uncharacterized protein n=1 Tax=Mucilaginibacter panaciglaebae TaxID=502331 RepID=A0ABP7WMU3_9SPHI